MRVMTYNVLDGGRDGRDFARLSEVLAVIEAQRPQVLKYTGGHRCQADGAPKALPR